MSNKRTTLYKADHEESLIFEPSKVKELIDAAKSARQWIGEGERDSDPKLVTDRRCAESRVIFDLLKTLDSSLAKMEAGTIEGKAK